ncbi:MAG: peptidylprolyl isomerase [Erysipelotrichaceae bacterium]|nr:peptidylprolyl isomerase [Erysipelotrichaceae bacterium]
MKTSKIMTAFLLASLLAGCSQQTQTTSQTDGASEKPQETAKAETQDLIEETVYVEMEVENYGTILLELDGKAAPVTVTNFVNLVNDKFYDGITFHRIMDGFMIQGGDPTGTGYNGSGTTITGEFAQNGYDNPISHTAGTISMARSNDPNSASSQFFICVADDQFLDGSYAAFGHVIEGMDVCLKIASDAKPVDDNGTIKPEEQPVIKYAKVVEH